MIRAQRILRRALISLAACTAFACITVPNAQADLNFADTGVSLNAIGGEHDRQAGSHPDFSFRFDVQSIETLRDGIQTVSPAEAVRDVDLELPPGLVGNPTPFPACPPELLVGADPSHFNLPSCPTESQVGLVKLFLNFGSVEVGLFNIVHGPDVPARFGFNYLGAVGTITPRVRPGDYGLSAGSFQISQGLPVFGATVTFWGYPSSPAHDSERAGADPFIVGNSYPSAAPKVPFFSNPTACPDSAQTFTARGDSWEHPGVFDVRQIGADEEGTPFIWEGCEDLPFAPQVELTAGSRLTHSPAGLDFHLELPQSESPEGKSTSAAKRVALTLPEGMSISPSVAAAQSGCTQAQVGLGTNDAPTCPSSSKIGEIQLETPLLDEALQGEFVLAAQNDNPFHATYAVYMLIDGPGFWLKLPGQLLVDRQSGQLHTVFSDLPQLPFEAVDVQLNGGPRAPLSTPNSCGTYNARTEITPWARPTEPVVQDIAMQFNENCSGGGWSPSLKGGTANPSAGKRSPFSIQITRQDGEQNLSRLDITLPKGQLASLKGVAECPEAQAGSGQCPASSQIGVARAAVGVGSSPLQVPQPGKAPTALFLGGPYKGAPLSVIALVPAQAGPFDLGNVVVRTALEVDSTTAQVTAKSDPLPQIIEGVPLSYREVRIELTRPDFAVNPTNCEPMQITSTLTSVGGAQARPSVPYQVGSCASLAFGPSLQLAMSGQTKRAGHPALTATLKAPEGQANIASTTVILPKSSFIDQGHVGNPCTRVQFNEGKCPAKSVLGTAVAHSPLLDKPLEGPVYFRSNGGERQLPDIVADLNGQIHVVLVGFIDSKKVGKETSLVRTRFASVPDAPVSKFVLRLKGGKRGLIQNSANLCKVKPRAEVKMGGQNGKTHDFKTPISTKCGKKSKSKK